MNKESILYGIIGLLAGSLLTIAVATTAVNNNQTGMMRMMGMGRHIDQDEMMSDRGMSMSDMADELRGKTGDDFDNAFLRLMIEHHQGAIDMSNLARQNAKHDEIKSLAKDILSAQSKEIDMMQSWQGEWGYKNIPMSH